MKSIIKQTAFAFLLVSCFGSCKKSDSPTTTPPPAAPPSKNEITLTKTPWLIDNQGIDTNKNGVIDIQDVRMLSPCNTDDIWEFVQGGVLNFNEGPIKCNAGDPQTIHSAWHFADNEASLYLDLLNSNFKIFKLTDTQLQIYKEVSTNGTIVWNFAQFKR